MIMVIIILYMCVLIHVWLFATPWTVARQMLYARDGSWGLYLRTQVLEPDGLGLKVGSDDANSLFPSL